MRLGDFDYPLPKTCIAQHPLAQRDCSRLMMLRRVDGSRRHLRFFEIAEHVQPGDLLVLNDTSVFPGRLNGRKGTGGRAELLLTEPESTEGRACPQTSLTWQCIIRPSARMRVGQRIHFGEGFQCKILSRKPDDMWVVQFEPMERPFWQALLKAGKTPLPPYIRRNGNVSLEREDRERYQTVYAKNIGAAAAPTAGLHFTQRLLQNIMERGVEICYLTLHVGVGTFVPVRNENITRHRMHSEFYSIPAETAASINKACSEHRRIIAVGTTVTRALEHAALSGRRISAGSGRTDLFIRPGHTFRIVDALITNFHLPRSTLLMLVSAFAGRKVILEAYREAVQLGYRFYSYGDAMFIE
ncbi:MAG: tRNA preQ1(34) S-adenosylmethionine ribosyltransferase-isomerase QueA [Deltaproteobacteria bacterium]|nr:tRNA preQ1(34) S-adenosylmethionine ribosyltransferase-isomerase QueA [Deltaproteobacteria bacterium]MBW2306456.1 tRNA preQ1(34) S-adenosylmethionine ribosyltransferase-isomerase QueA [Deltaproteobacteria bacterium]